jgi:hypothetical protein
MLPPNEKAPAGFGKGFRRCLLSSLFYVVAKGKSFDVNLWEQYNKKPDELPSSKVPGFTGLFDKTGLPRRPKSQAEAATGRELFLPTTGHFFISPFLAYFCMLFPCSCSYEDFSILYARRIFSHIYT